MVWVRPGKFPANVIVAPNSPSARAQHNTAPASREGAIRGIVTVRKTVSLAAPSVAAASSYPRSEARKAPSTVITRKGIATNVSATMTPAVVNGKVMPVHWSRSRPRTPCRPNASSRATPPTTGGRTSGNVTRARSSVIPRAVERARTQARGTPSTTEAAVAALAHTRDSRRASRTWLSARIDGRPRHGARTSSPASGASRNRAPSRAGTPSGQGIAPRAVAARAFCGVRRTGACPSGAGSTGFTRSAGLGVISGAQSGLREPGRCQDPCTVGGQNVVGERLGCGPVRCLGQGGDRVLGGGVDGGGDQDAPDLVTGSPYVGDVDDPGVDLAEGHLGQHGLDVNLLGDRGHREPGVGEYLLSRHAARNGLLAQRNLHRGPGQVG